MRWDIFCKVIDNFGDIGVCWRLCADLAARGEEVRLWVDDASALDWMAPQARSGGVPGITVLDWDLSASLALLTGLAPAEVWVEAFGCDPAEAFVAARAQQVAQGRASPPVWINLEYLSAEGYVERSHGLPSPVMQGPARGWTKYFYYPGFTARTGGLLHEADLANAQADFDAAAWLAQLNITRRPQERVIALFCYEPAVLPQLLERLAADQAPSRLLVTAGRASAAVQAATVQLDQHYPDWNGRGALALSYLPQLRQADFDHLLWAADLNFVRGEDSLVRAIWAGKALVWQIYPQSDDAHQAKLQAFLDRMGAPTSLRQFHLLWNARADAQVAAPLPDLPRHWPPDSWGLACRRLREDLLAQSDLSSQLLDFIAKRR